MVIRRLTEEIIGTAIEVHKALGPGLLEPAYEECLAHEFYLAKLSSERHLALPVIYKSLQLDCAYRKMDNLCRLRASSVVKIEEL
ncbi:MAG: GxxExxY protein [Deltaproteobacteria bacterium]|nr:MAG: GxxExxY protein [Deltaproteobacteria bacterium]